MKVGVDGTLLGAWVDVSDASSILDIGSGCGLIALMCAQRNQVATVTAVEVEHEAAVESQGNFSSSPWANRLKLIETDAMSLSQGEYDVIISNPPFFNSGIKNISTSRELARHGVVLNPLSIIDIATCVATPKGRLSMIFPTEMLDSVDSHATSAGWHRARICRVRGHADAPIKRVMVEYSKTIPIGMEQQELVLELKPGVPTTDYRNLCKDFYLKF